jgi:hypothetical protein
MEFTEVDPRAADIISRYPQGLNYSQRTELLQLELRSKEGVIWWFERRAFAQSSEGMRLLCEFPPVAVPLSAEATYVFLLVLDPWSGTTPFKPQESEVCDGARQPAILVEVLDLVVKWKCVPRVLERLLGVMEASPHGSYVRSLRALGMEPPTRLINVLLGRGCLPDQAILHRLINTDDGLGRYVIHIHVCYSKARMLMQTADVERTYRCIFSPSSRIHRYDMFVAGACLLMCHDTVYIRRAMIYLSAYSLHMARVGTPPIPASRLYQCSAAQAGEGAQLPDWLHTAREFMRIDAPGMNEGRLQGTLMMVASLTGQPIVEPRNLSIAGGGGRPEDRDAPMAMNLNILTAEGVRRGV